MKQAFLLFSHQLTPEQVKELQNKFNIERFVYLPPELQDIWSNIPPDISSLREHIEPILTWLDESAKSKDYVLVQGEFGAVFLTVDFCKYNNLIPIYATTKRVLVEEVMSDNTVKIVRKFTHIRFREYEEYR